MENNGESKSAMKKRHRGELKKFQDETARLLKQCKDKKKKKELEAERNKIEQELIKKHQEELKKKEQEDLEELGEQPELTEEKQVETKKEPTKEELEEIKRQKKKEKTRRRNQRKKEKEREMRKQAEYNLMISGGSKRDQELKAILKQLNPLGLTIKTIPSDGHCLYRAVADQLQERGENISQDEYLTIRKKVAEYMRNHVDDFIAFLETPTGEMMSQEQYMEYCDRVENSSDWGGQVELQALVRVLNMCIRIFTSDSPIIVMGEEYKDNGILNLSYHRHFYSLGEHYNSIIKIKE